MEIPANEKISGSFRGSADREESDIRMNPMTTITAGSLVVAAFLIGFVPQYLKSRDLRNQLNSTRQDLALNASNCKGTNWTC
jgi:hypothetical protein